MMDGIIRDLERRGLPGVIRQREVTTTAKTKTKTKTTTTTTSSPLPPRPNMGTQHIDPSTLTDEQKLALKRWSSLTKQQREDLSAKYTDAVNKKKQAKEDAAYRPSTRQDPSTDYSKWDKWAKEENNETFEDDSTTTTVAPDITTTFSSVLNSGRLSTTLGKIEAFLCCFFFSFSAAFLLLPVELGTHTFTKQVCFALLMGVCVLADQKGHVILCFRGLEGGLCGMLLFYVILAPPIVGTMFGGCAGLLLQMHSRS